MHKTLTSKQTSGATSWYKERFAFCVVFTTEQLVPSAQSRNAEVKYPECTWLSMILWGRWDIFLLVCYIPRPLMLWALKYSIASFLFASFFFCHCLSLHNKRISRRSLEILTLSEQIHSMFMFGKTTVWLLWINSPKAFACAQLQQTI